MTKMFLFAMLFTLVGCSTGKLVVQNKVNSSVELLREMNKKYRGKWFDQFTFVQETIKYDSAGNETEKSIWYEAIDYPKKFRIDFGPLNAGNAVIFDKDSVWVFKENKFTRKAYAPREFLLMKGGLYHLTVDETINQLESYGYNCQLFRKDVFNNKPVYVLGAEKGDLKSKQFWIDAEHFYLHRRISTSKNKTLDVVYSEHIFSDGGWVEQVVEFWSNGVYVQKEFYKSIDTKPELDDAVFDHKMYGKTHWFKG